MRFSRNGSGWCAVAVIATGAYSAHAGELVVNGGFETGSFFPWIAPPPIFNEQHFEVSGGGGHSGSRWARLSSTQLLFVHQFLPTTAGQDYELSFWLRKPANFPSLFVVRWEGEAVFNQFVIFPDSDWHQLTVPLHSDFDGSLLEFGQHDFPGEYHIDDVSVIPVPTPAGASLLVMAGAFAARRRRR